MEESISELNLKYLQSLKKPLDPLLQEMADYAKELDIPIVSQEVGVFLELLTLVKNPENVLEIGTAIGFSSIYIGRALKEGGKLITLERSAPSVEIAKRNFMRAGISDKVSIIFGSALETLPKLEPNFDMVFIDAQKEEYKEYLQHSIRLLRSRGVIIIDNLLWRGQVARGAPISDKFKTSSAALQEFNKLFLAHQKISSIILPIGDGIGFAVVK